MKQYNQWSLIPEWFPFLSRLFLMIQNHIVQPVRSDSQANDSFSLVLFSESESLGGVTK